MMKAQEMMKVFEITQALLNGHFQLSSGLHSNQYFQCALVLQYPMYAEILGDQIGNLFRGQGITCVIGPALGGVIIAYEVSRSLDTKAIFAERVNGQMQLRRGFEVLPDDNVLVVEDVITTGGSAKEVVELLTGKCVVAGVAAIVDRSSHPVSFGVPFSSLLKMPVKTFAPNVCPFCLEGKPLDKPGSRAVLR